MKNGKLFSKFSVIDLGVILLILLVVAVVVIRMGWFSTPEAAVEQTQPITYETVDCTVKLRYATVPADLQAEPFTVGERVFISGKEFGTIETVERETAEQRVVLRDGSVVTAERKDAYNYIVTLKTTLTRKNGMLYFQKEPVAVGTGGTFASHYYAGRAFVIGVEKNQ